jgi:Fe-S cluster biogenesis protein NfuA
MNTLMNSELTDRVEKALDTIRPYLEADGGNVKIWKLQKRR